MLARRFARDDQGRCQSTSERCCVSTRFDPPADVRPNRSTWSSPRGTPTAMSPRVTARWNIDVRLLAVMALVVAVFSMSVRSARCERSRDVLATAMLPELAESDSVERSVADDAPPVDEPSAEGAAALDRACSSAPTVTSSMVTVSAPSRAVVAATRLPESSTPRRVSFSLDRPPRSC